MIRCAVLSFFLALFPSQGFAASNPLEPLSSLGLHLQGGFEQLVSGVEQLNFGDLQLIWPRSDSEEKTRSTLRELGAERAQLVGLELELVVPVKEGSFYLRTFVHPSKMPFFLSFSGRLEREVRVDGTLLAAMDGKTQVLVDGARRLLKELRAGDCAQLPLASDEQAKALAPPSLQERVLKQLKEEREALPELCAQLRPYFVEASTILPDPVLLRVDDVLVVLYDSDKQAVGTLKAELLFLGDGSLGLELGGVLRLPKTP